jgi:hypothetical protein
MVDRKPLIGSDHSDYDLLLVRAIIATETVGTDLTVVGIEESRGDVVESQFDLNSELEVDERLLFSAG